MAEPNLALVPKTDRSSFRQMVIGTWRTAKDPSVYGSLSLEMDEALRYLTAFRVATGRRNTVTHLMAKAVGRVLHEVPDANAMLRGRRSWLRTSADVFFQVAESFAGPWTHFGGVDRPSPEGIRSQPA